MNIVEIGKKFEQEVACGQGEWLGSPLLAASTVAQCNGYIEELGLQPLPEATVPQVMIVGAVKKSALAMPTPVPEMVRSVHDPLSDSNHESAFRQLCERYNVKPFRPHSYWLGFVLNDKNEHQSYHLILNTYGDLDGMNTRRRVDLARRMMTLLEHVNVCVVIESPDSVFNARTGTPVVAHERGIDFSVPW